ncbi:MAG TPA: hypothetical protein VNM37_16490, partial [Candidatus Dormibacteraeota bacterium]|nr:hypothetical protein [Candidatus Dormibacteraeota bacterium]
MHFTPEQYERFWTHELEKYQYVGQGRLRAACPVHQGDSPDTLAVDLNTGYAYCFKCHNGNGSRGWTMIDFAMTRYGLSKECAWDHVRYIVGETAKPSTAVWRFPFPKPLTVTSDAWRLGTLARRIEEYVKYLDELPDAGGPGWEPYALYIYETIE